MAIAPFHLQPSLGSLFVFAKESIAVEEMARDLGVCGQRSEFKTLPPDVREAFIEVSGKLVQADKLLALRSLEDARGIVAANPRKQHVVDKLIERAEDQYEEGLAALEKDCVSEKGGWWKKHPGEVAAISHFERSWLFSRLAQQVAGGGWYRDIDSLDVDHEGRSLAWGDKEIEQYEEAETEGGRGR